MQTYGHPFLLIRPFIFFFGRYEKECWRRDDEGEEGGLCYYLFGHKFQYGVYFINF